MRIVSFKISTYSISLKGFWLFFYPEDSFESDCNKSQLRYSQEAMYIFSVYVEIKGIMLPIYLFLRKSNRAFYAGDQITEYHIVHPM